MKKIWLLAAVLAMGIAPFSTPATANEPGDEWTVGSYCIGTDLEFIRKFTDDIVRGGIEVYRHYMSDPSAPCYDTRMHPQIQPVGVVLVERLWAFSVLGGEELIMWVVEDNTGMRGYSWFSPAESEVETDPA